jgi:7,8-dihydropterin-6-yl-methyl-4-(beta-D-ribofuranosyl)aminobenzene 5'-phosphate synthase
MTCRITTLCENTVPVSRGLVGEHGLSMLIECDEGTVLFDTGQGMGLTENARRLGKDLSRVSSIVLSHGHYDHTGGLLAALEAAGRAKVIAHPDAFLRKVGVLPDGEPLDIGIPFAASDVEGLADLCLTRDPFRVSKGILTTGTIPAVTAFEHVDEGLFVEKAGELVRDDVADDLALILESPRGSIVIAGCSHRGVVNALLHARQLTGDERIAAVIGGMHLARASAAQLEGTIRAFAEMKVGKIVMSHCSGLEASSAVRAALGEKVAFNRVGSSFEL